jgi:antitoxin component of MazEF toxin-antitoxin module
MPYLQNRKLLPLGKTSKAITLPKGWVKFYNLADGDRIMVLGDTILVVCHPKDEKKARKLLDVFENEKTNKRH